GARAFALDERRDDVPRRRRSRGAALRRGQFAFWGRITPQRFSRERSVFGCRPSRRAAPRSPSITQRVSVSTCSTYQRSTSAIVRGGGVSIGAAIAATGNGSGAGRRVCKGSDTTPPAPARQNHR